MNRRALLVGISALAVVTAAHASNNLTPFFSALNYGIKGDGSTNDTAAINAFFTTCVNNGAVAYFPGRTYNLSNGALTLPNNSTVLCARNAVFNRSLDIGGATPYNVYTEAFISIGSDCTWTGGTLNNTAVLATSTTSKTVATGAITFTTQAGLPLTNASFVRVWSRANPANNFEGPVTSYSGTTLVLNAVADSGSGTYTDWNITFGAVYQCPMVLHGSVRAVIENVQVIGNWYAGIVLDGWNPSTGGPLNVNFCTVRNCYLKSVQNRAIYLYGFCNDNVVADCYVQGTSGITNYGVNCNPANATGTFNSQSRNKISNITVDGAAFQGIELGDQCYYGLVSNCSVAGMTEAAGVGYLIQQANGNSPQFNLLANCTAINCPTGFAIVSAFYTNIIGGSAVSGTNGYVVENTSAIASENSIQDVLATGNASSGISISAGVVNTLLTGRSVANTGANLTDAGTGTISTNLVVT